MTACKFVHCISCERSGWELAANDVVASRLSILNRYLQALEHPKPELLSDYKAPNLKKRSPASHLSAPTERTSRTIEEQCKGATFAARWWLRNKGPETTPPLPQLSHLTTALIVRARSTPPARPMFVPNTGKASSMKLFSTKQTQEKPEKTAEDDELLASQQAEGYVASNIVDPTRGPDGSRWKRGPAWGSGCQRWPGADRADVGWAGARGLWEVRMPVRSTPDTHPPAPGHHDQPNTRRSGPGQTVQTVPPGL
ncbi:hypothetical protein BDK51DRAFT_47348 [Blyttiomyces helicus]|uniref:Uncharacterized protein n=1 Tax=Blyttiomyces helicus TaxID=388810 RepID=A0A4P9WCH2_9FUNG|nr:hypothetical protein BDK51DRAFT_47348 [Blyttiomyces helicus]|eukprot:RKO90359.1 hypothetical protein BDK51DRAFT_47348 [Blyttiomyces helicus]